MEKKYEPPAITFEHPAAADAESRGPREDCSACIAARGSPIASCGLHGLDVEWTCGACGVRFTNRNGHTCEKEPSQ